jgi:cytoskeletal protein CcmA (bactofilin family)
MIWRRDDAEAEHAEQPRVPAPPERKDKDMADSGEVTIVGTGARLEGNVVSAGNLRIDGQVKGQINADGDVVLSPQSQVEADIRSQNVSVAGRFKGNIAVKGKAHLARGGRIDGNITSKTLVVEEGGIFHGQSIMDAGAGSGSSSPQAALKSVGAAAKEGEEKKPDQVKV